jgi:hypothetical protein
MCSIYTHLTLQQQQTSGVNTTHLTLQQQQTSGVNTTHLTLQQQQTIMFVVVVT